MENQNQFQQNPFPNAQQALPNATAVLVLGIISIVGCMCYGIIGLICGTIAMVLANKDLRLYNENPDAWLPGSVSNLRSGRICAIVGLCLSGATFLFMIIYFIFVGSLVFTSAHHGFSHI